MIILCSRKNIEDKKDITRWKPSKHAYVLYKYYIREVEGTFADLKDTGRGQILDNVLM